MSAGRKTLGYSVLAVVVAAVIHRRNDDVLYKPPHQQLFPESGPVGPAIQLTDPPLVPPGTSSLNLTYTSVNVLVGEPASGGQLTTTSVSLSPSGGSATVDLLKLQNVSQTIASTSVPTGSTVYSVGFTVQSVSISINGTVYPVTLAVGGADLGVTLANPTALVANSSVLLELNPVVADTPTGYQMIPSMVGSSGCPQNTSRGTMAWAHNSRWARVTTRSLTSQRPRYPRDSYRYPSPETRRT